MRIECKQLTGEIGDRLDTYFKRKNCFIEVDPGQVIMPKKYGDIGEEILDCPVRESDVWLISYPRTGSTWAQEMVWLLGNNFDYKGAMNLQVLRTPLLELDAILYDDHKEWLKSNIGKSVQLINTLPSPRFIKSHLPSQLLPRQLDIVKPKTIYISRNPKDLCVSYYHYCILVHGLVCTFEEFCDIFLSNKAPIGAMWAHVLPFWRKRHDANILFLKYEDMKKDLPGVIKKCAQFLDVSHQLTEAKIIKLCDHLNFDEMQKNPSVNLEKLIDGDEVHKSSVKFIRKGQVGDWKNYMSDEMSAKFDKWIELNTLDSDLFFEYE